MNTSLTHQLKEGEFRHCNKHELLLLRNLLHAYLNAGDVARMINIPACGMRYLPLPSTWYDDGARVERRADGFPGSQRNHKRAYGQQFGLLALRNNRK